MNFVITVDDSASEFEIEDLIEYLKNCYPFILDIEQDCSNCKSCRDK